MSKLILSCAILLSVSTIAMQLPLTPTSITPKKTDHQKTRELIESIVAKKTASLKSTSPAQAKAYIFQLSKIHQETRNEFLRILAETYVKAYRQVHSEIISNVAQHEFSALEKLVVQEFGQK